MPEWKKTVCVLEEEAEGPIVQAQSKPEVFFKRFIQRRTVVVVAVFLPILLIIAVVGPELAPYDPVTLDYDNLLSGPDPAYVLGTDKYSRGVLNRLMAGSRLTLSISLSSVIVDATIGTFLDALAGYYGGILETLVMRGPDVLFAFPSILLAIATVTMIGPSIISIVIVMAIFTVPSFICIMCSTTPSVKELLCMEATQSIGCKGGRILSVYIFPEMMQMMTANFTTCVGTAILAAASLSLLGFNANAVGPDWGAMLSSGRNYIGIASRLVYFPGLLIFLTALVFNLLDDGLQDTLDPKVE